MPTSKGPDRAAALPPVPRYLVEQAEHAIERADSKAATLGAAAIAMLTVLTSDGAAARRNSAAEVFLVAGLLSWVAGVLALAAALMPRLHRAGPGEHAVSFCDVPEEYDADRMRSLVAQAAGDAENWLLAQGHILSRIAVVKYRMIRAGMALLTLSGLGALGMFLT